jgi:filamentous hemagglutinin family protein
MLFFLPALLSANPTGGTVAAGSATIAGQGTSAVVIKQASNTAIINWQSFSINSGESTSFLQPGANSAALNRVLGGGTSIINGTLSANGQVYLINGNGVIVGPGGIINANAFTASTRNISDADFLSGNLHFTGSSAAGVQNLGSITALGGNVALIGRNVDNEGTITAPKGTAALVAGDDVLLAQMNTDGSTVTVSPAATAPKTSAPVGVKNGGAITAAAAELKAANGNIYALAVQNSGTVRATTVTHQGGHIWLTSDSGKVSNSGTLNASATVAGGKGGSVTLKSKTGAASHTGQIIAQGGQGGAGGSVDISGAQVNFSGLVNLSAPGGTRGNLLIDPTDIDIITGGGTDLAGAAIDPSAIVSALNSSDVTITASNSITVFNEIDASANSNPGNLVLDAPVLQLTAPILLNGTLSGGAGQVFVGAGGLVQNGIDAMASGGQINLVDATYALSTQLLINKDMTIFGNGATLSGQGSTRILEIDGGSVAIVHTTFTGGNGAGSTGTSGSGNSGFGGAVMIYGQNTNANVSFFQDGFVGNSASAGGAIFNTSISGGGNSVVIENSTLTGNSAVNGSALYAQAAFGGSATFGLKADTIAENSGSGAIYCTVLSSGNATVTINDTILAGNNNGGAESDFVVGTGGALTDDGYNLYGQNGDAGGFVPGTTNDVLLAGPITNEVGPVGLYSGGLTPTLPLLSTSQSLEAGDPAFNGSSDENGITRGNAASFTGPNADIGAFEAQYISVQANNASNIYGSTPVFSYTITSGPGGPALLTGTPDLVTPETNVGTYGEDIGQGTVMAAPGYVLDFTNGDLTITPRDVTVLPDSGQNKIYGTTDPVLTYTTNPANAVSGLVNGDTLSGQPSYLGSGTYTSVGSYPTTLGTLANSNYNIVLSSAAPTFAITPRIVMINPTPGQSKIYGSPDPVLTYMAVPADLSTGLVNGDTLTGSLGELGAGPAAPVGTYPFTPGTLANSNYVVMVNSGTNFLITPRSATVTVLDGQGKTYGALDPALAYTVSGLVNGDTLSGAASYEGASQFANAGSYPTNLGTLSNPNYVLSPGSTSTFTISPAALYYAADQVQVPTGTTSFPAFTGTVVGFVGEDSQANSTTGNLVFTTAATPSAPQGYYEIDGSGLTTTSPNYVIAGQAATNVAALIIGNPPPRGTMQAGTTSMPTSPAEVQTAASTPNTPTSQAIAQTSTPPNSGQPGNPNPATPASPSTTPAPTPPPPSPDITVSAISDNESIDSTPMASTTPGNGGGGSATASGDADSTAVAQSSSFNPDIGATAVTPGQSVTVGGTPGVPPPPVVAAQLNQILGIGAQDTLSGALDAITTASTSTSASTPTGDSSTSPSAASTDSTSSTSSTSSTTPGSPDQSSQSASAAAVAAAASQPNAYANGPIILGPSAMIAPGQTISLSGGRASAGPPPASVQTAFNQGFSPDSRNDLAKAAGL